MASFDDYANAAMAVAAVVLVGLNIKEEYAKQQAQRATRNADRFVEETKARMRSMHSHILDNRGSKEAYKEAFTMAKNVIQFDAIAELGDTVYATNAVVEITVYIDRMLAKV
jgi:hypothetical protein